MKSGKEARWIAAEVVQHLPKLIIPDQLLQQKEEATAEVEADHMIEPRTLNLNLLKDSKTLVYHLCTYGPATTFSSVSIFLPHEI